jgi:Ca2+/Na+ antiporter
MEFKMKIRYEKKLEDSAAFQMYWHAENAKKKCRKNYVTFILLCIVFSAVILYGVYNKKYEIAGFAALALIVFIFLSFRTNASLASTFYKHTEKLYKDGLASLAGESESSYDSDYFYNCDLSAETKTGWSSIDKIVVCPDYLFVYNTPLSAYVISREGIIEGDFDGFSRGVIEAYQDYAGKHGFEAEVIETGWTFEKKNIAKGLRLTRRVKKFSNVIIWGMIFWITGLILFGFAATFLCYICDRIGWVDGNGKTAIFSLILWFVGMGLFAVGGVLLSFFGVLPDKFAKEE